MTTQLSLQDVTVRPAIATDVEWGAKLLFAAGPDLFSYVFASPAVEAEHILRQAFAYPNHAFSYEHAQVLEVSETPVGLLMGYSGRVKRQAEAGVHNVMARILPLSKLPRILVNLADLSRIKQEVISHQYYVLSLSIAPEFQNRGLGTALLKDAEMQAQDLNCRSICLDVAYTNTRAKALFDRLGYQVTCRKTSERFDRMTRAGGIQRLEKSLT